MKSYYANKERSTKGLYLPVDDGDLSVDITASSFSKNPIIFIEGKIRAIDVTSTKDIKPISLIRHKGRVLDVTIILDLASPIRVLLVAVHCLSPIHQINPESKVVQLCVTIAIVIDGKVARIITNDTVPLAVQHGIGSIHRNDVWPALLCGVTVM